MEFSTGPVLAGGVTVFILLFLFRRQFKRTLLHWIDCDSTSSDDDLADIIAHEKERMQAKDEKREEGRSDHSGL